MTTHLLFLRAVNVGGTGAVSMAQLRAWLENLGFKEVRTLLNSGNVVLRSSVDDPAEIETQLTHAAAKGLGATPDFFVRTAAEWDEVIRRNPLRPLAARDPSHFAVILLKDPPSATQARSLRAAIQGREVVRAVGRQLYAHYPDGMGRSKLTLPLIERHLGTRGTGRSWNTVLKMQALAAAHS